MADFNVAIAHILKNEGGYSFHPSDPGGETNHGISLKFLKGIGLYGDFNNDGFIDGNDIKNMSPEDAVGIYKKFWWDKYNLGSINNQSIATKIFDMSINMGVSQATLILQRSINEVMGKAIVIVDGDLGKQTLLFTNIAKPESLQNLLIINSCMFYMELAEKNKGFKNFIKGWLTRAIKPYRENTNA